MKLYHSGTSPYARKCMVVLHLTGQLGATEIVAASGTPVEPNPATTAVNPLGKIPCLVTDTGQAIFDSRVITRYLDARAGGGLYPADDRLWEVLTREALADGIIDAAILVVYENRLRPEALRFRPWIEGQLGKVQRALGDLERQAGGFGAAPDAGQIAVGCALGYLDLRFPDIGWRDGRPALAAWYEGIAALPAMRATVPG